MQPENIKKYKDIDRDIRSIDPIEATHPDFNDKEMLGGIVAAIEDVRQIRATDADLTGENAAYSADAVGREQAQLIYKEVNLLLDFLYSENGGEKLELSRFKHNVALCHNLIGDALRSLPESERVLRWELSLKQLDLAALSTYRNARDARTTLAGTPDGEAAYVFAENQMTTLLQKRSVALMHNMAGEADGESEQSRKARGMLFEVLAVSYARLRTLQDETFDRIFIRSALEREDDHVYPEGRWPKDGYPRRTFDVLVHDDGLGEDRLYQLKNNLRDEKVYADPIIKIQGDRFGLILRNLKAYTIDFAVATRGIYDPGVPKDRLDNAMDSLDSAFGGLIELSR